MDTTREHAWLAAHTPPFSHPHAVLRCAGWYVQITDFIVALQRLTAAFPAAQWYLLTDDDTFVYAHNLLCALAEVGSGTAVHVAMGDVHYNDGHCPCQVRSRSHVHPAAALCRRREGRTRGCLCMSPSMLGR